MAPENTSTDPEQAAGRNVGLLDSRAVRFALIYALPAALCLLAGSAIYVSRLGIAQDVHVLAEPEWIAGGRTAVRVLAYGGNGQLLDEVGVTLTFTRQGQEPMELGSVRAAPGVPAVDVDVDVPDWPLGPCTLTASVESSAGQEDISAEVTLVTEIEDRPLHMPPPARDRPSGDTRAHDVGGVSVELLPYGQALVPNLNNVLFVRTTDGAGRPIKAEVALELVGGATNEAVPAKVQTDLLGLAALSVHPLANALVFEVTLPGAEAASPAGGAGGADGGAGAVGGDAGVAPETVTDGGAGVDGDAGDADSVAPAPRILVATAPAQLVLQLASPVPEDSGPMKVRVSSLHSSRPVYVDARAAGAWIVGRTSLLQKNRASLSLPHLRPGLVLVQGYIAPVAVGRGFSAHHAYVREPGEDPAEVLREIATLLRDRDVDRAYAEALLSGGSLSDREVSFERTAAFLLSRLDRGFYQPHRLVSSERVRSAALGQFQQDFKIRIIVAISVLGLLVTLLIAYSFSVSAWKGRQHRIMWDADTGAAGEDIHMTSMGRPKGLDRFRIVVQIALMVGAVAVGFVLLAVLVSVMSWHG